MCSLLVGCIAMQDAGASGRHDSLYSSECSARLGGLQQPCRTGIAVEERLCVCFRARLQQLVCALEQSVVDLTHEDI